MPTAFQDYYSTLGVSRTATPKEIKSAWRKIARQNHPDVRPDDKGAESRFKAASEAYEVLSDPKKRKQYDELGPRWQEYEQWEKAGRPGQNPFSSGNRRTGNGQPEYHSVSAEELESLFGQREPFSDFFQTFFGGGAAGGASRRSNPTARRQRGDDIQGEAEISLEEAYRGTARTVELSSPQGMRRVEVKIPPGIADGARVRAKGQGGPGSGADAGDLYVQVRIAPHPRFERDGSTLRTRVDVPLDIALLGGVVKVPSLSGGNIELTVPANTQNGSRLRLRGQGMPIVGGGNSGDLIAEVFVRLPVPLPPTLVEWAQELRRLQH